MASLEEEISALKAKIEKYEAKLDAATTEAEKDRYASLIISSQTTLNIYLAEKQQGE